MSRRFTAPKPTVIRRTISSPDESLAAFNSFCNGKWSAAPEGGVEQNEDGEYLEPSDQHAEDQ